MGYLHIENLYRPAAQIILMFKECYAMEKIHGTSTHIEYFPPLTPSSTGKLQFFSGGESHAKFITLFNESELLTKIIDMGFGNRPFVIYGEAYGGSQQGMSHTYGNKLKFIAFDVCLEGTNWLSVPEADAFCKTLNIEFVHYVKVSTDLKELDAQRDAPSIQAIRNGISMIVPEGADLNRPCGMKVEPYGNFGDRIANPRKREGVVLRPLIDFTDSHGNRVICKHKGDEFRETASPRVVEDPNKLVMMEDANKISNEWITMTRLEHVLDKISHENCGMELLPKILPAMVDDVTREASGEIVVNDSVIKAIRAKTVSMYKEYLKRKLNEQKI